MDETNEQLCEDLIQAEAELALLRKLNSGTIPAEDEFDVDGLSATAATAQTLHRQSSAEVEAALAWAEKAAMEQSLVDAQRELAELRNPPEPEGSGFFSAVFGGSSKKEILAVVNSFSGEFILFLTQCQRASSRCVATNV